MKRLLLRSYIWLLVLLMFFPSGGLAQETASEPRMFGQEELSQMLAPIALYPDSVMIQIFMAATYPRDVTLAAQWVKTYPNLKGQKLANALEKKSWDPSVKSLVNFPSVLSMMNEYREWTQNIGTAFNWQKDQVMATVQELRAKAQAEGNLYTTEEQIVDVRDDSIVIEPANPEIIYVPTYDPTVVYGSWWYPAYPPFYYRPPGYAVYAAAGLVTFGIGIACGAAWGYAWGDVHWPGYRVYVNPARNMAIYNNFYRHPLPPPGPRPFPGHPPAPGPHPNPVLGHPPGPGALPKPYPGHPPGPGAPPKPYPGNHHPAPGIPPVHGQPPGAPHQAGPAPGHPPGTAPNPRPISGNPAGPAPVKVPDHAPAAPGFQPSKPNPQQNPAAPPSGMNRPPAQPQQFDRSRQTPAGQDRQQGDRGRSGIPTSQKPPQTNQGGAINPGGSGASPGFGIPKSGGGPPPQMGSGSPSAPPSQSAPPQSSGGNTGRSRGNQPNQAAPPAQGGGGPAGSSGGPPPGAGPPAFGRGGPHP